MQITPCLTFNSQAKEAAEFYVSLFSNSSIVREIYYFNEIETNDKSLVGVRFKLANIPFYALNVSFVGTNPSISFFVNCETTEEINELWSKLTNGGLVLMELEKYPFSERFGFVQDKYSVSWQLNLEPKAQKITPFLMFVGPHQGKAEEAVKFYCSLFENSKIETIVRYGKNEGEPEGTAKTILFKLNGQEFRAMDSAGPHNFCFNEAVSLYVSCKTQDEIDRYWAKLTSNGGSESMGGWLKDRFGVSWQIVNANFDELISEKHPKKAKRVMDEIMVMGKLDLQKIMEVYNQSD
jgi:predicted 3-demethylubiquinone-9 3-methyltransferase (glyoxalase superfamily)